jgi:hypothetical protein
MDSSDVLLTHASNLPTVERWPGLGQKAMVWNHCFLKQYM